MGATVAGAPVWVSTGTMVGLVVGAEALVGALEVEDPDRNLAGHDPTPHDMLRLRELHGRVEVAIGSLPPDYRQLILLRHRQHCRYDEIARITQLPIGTVKNRIFRAREILRHELADLLDSEVRHA